MTNGYKRGTAIAHRVVVNVNGRTDKLAGYNLYSNIVQEEK
jgi:hypothetical protein